MIAAPTTTPFATPSSTLTATTAGSLAFRTPAPVRKTTRTGPARRRRPRPALWTGARTAGRDGSVPSRPVSGPRTNSWTAPTLATPTTFSAWARSSRSSWSACTGRLRASGSSGFTTTRTTSAPTFTRASRTLWATAMRTTPRLGSAPSSRPPSSVGLGTCSSVTWTACNWLPRAGRPTTSSL